MERIENDNNHVWVLEVPRDPAVVSQVLEAKAIETTRNPLQRPLIITSSPHPEKPNSTLLHVFSNGHGTKAGLIDIVTRLGLTTRGVQDEKTDK